MGMCQVCREFFPPHFTLVLDVDDSGNEVYKCVYCESGKDVLGYDFGDGTGMRDYSKQQCIKDYKELLAKMKDSAKAREKLAK